MGAPASPKPLEPQFDADNQRPDYSPAPMAAVSSVRKDDQRSGQVAEFNDAIARASG